MATMVVDFIKLWAQIKTRLREKLGIYKLPTGAPVVISGRSFPRLTLSQALDLRKALDAAYQDTIRQMTAARRNTAGLRNAWANMQDRVADWAVDVDFVYEGQKFEGKYLFAPAVRDIMDIYDRFAIALSSSIWVGFNIESAYDRMLWALDNTTGGWLLKWPFKMAYETVSAVAEGRTPKFVLDLDRYLRYAVYGGIAVGGLYLFREMRD